MHLAQLCQVIPLLFHRLVMVALILDPLDMVALSHTRNMKCETIFHVSKRARNVTVSHRINAFCG